MSQVLTHSFSIPVAKVVGVHGAIILQHFAFWHLANWGNSKNYHDGRFWTFNSIKAYSELFPYMTAKEIRGQLNRLERDEYIISSNYNATQFNRTKWYAMTSLGLDLMQIDESKRHLTKGQMDVTKGQIDSAKGQMNDRYNTDIDTVNNSSSTQAENSVTLEAEPSEKGKVPAAGGAAISRLRALADSDYRIREGFSMSRKIPAAKFDEYVRAFDAETGATGEVHTADKDLVKHFLNFSSVRYSVERKDAAINTRPGVMAPAPGKSSLPSNIPVFG